MFSWIVFQNLIIICEKITNKIVLRNVVNVKYEQTQNNELNEL